MSFRNVRKEMNGRHSRLLSTIESGPLRWCAGLPCHPHPKMHWALARSSFYFPFLNLMPLGYLQRKVRCAWKAETQEVCT